MAKRREGRTGQIRLDLGGDVDIARSYFRCWITTPKLEGKLVCVDGGERENGPVHARAITKYSVTSLGNVR
jgi:hypothetical protein